MRLLDYSKSAQCRHGKDTAPGKTPHALGDRPCRKSLPGATLTSMTVCYNDHRRDASRGCENGQKTTGGRRDTLRLIPRIVQGD